MTTASPNDRISTGPDSEKAALRQTGIDSEIMQIAQVRKQREEQPWPEHFPRGKPNPAVKGVSLFVAAAGLAVMAGWIFDIHEIKRISSAWVSMKFTTAFSFFISGISLYFMARAREGAFEKAQAALSITSFMLAILMGLLFFSAVFGIDTGIQNLFVHDPGDAKSVVPGMPSIPTIINFLLIAAAGVVTLVNPARVIAMLKIVGIIVGSIGAAAVTGYLFNTPLLYYFVPGVNSAMALHTALLFIAWGAALACL